METRLPQSGSNSIYIDLKFDGAFKDPRRGHGGGI